MADKAMRVESFKNKKQKDNPDNNDDLDAIITNDDDQMIESDFKTGVVPHAIIHHKYPWNVMRNKHLNFCLKRTKGTEE
eukprot:3679870-Ditylum_brightwellii.AAC.1